MYLIDIKGCKHTSMGVNYLSAVGIMRTYNILDYLLMIRSRTTQPQIPTSLDLRYTEPTQNRIPLDESRVTRGDTCEMKDIPEKSTEKEYCWSI